MFFHFSNFLSTFFHNASMLTKIVWKNYINSQNPIILDNQQLKIHRAFSDEIIPAILLYQANPVGVELFSLVNTLLCSNKFKLYVWLNVIQARLNARQCWPAVSTTTRMQGGLGVQQGLRDFIAHNRSQSFCSRCFCMQWLQLFFAPTLPPLWILFW